MLPMPFGISEIQVAGLPSRTLAGSLRVNFQLQRHCNARFGTRKLPATSIKNRVCQKPLLSEYDFVSRPYFGLFN
jgi:hypothetical protein